MSCVTGWVSIEFDVDFFARSLPGVYIALAGLNPQSFSGSVFLDFLKDARALPGVYER